jgi:translation initiation factor 3 subunit M
MTASTCVLVETGDEDPLVSVATLVDGLVGDASGKIAKECAALLEAGKFVDAVGKIMAHGAKLFADASEKDLEASVLIVGGLAQRLPAADAAACVDALVQAALASTERGPARANALFSLYNMTTDLTARLAILNKILAYVRSAKLGTLVAPLARHVEENYASWNLDPAATRAMLQSIFSMLAETSVTTDVNDAASARVLDLQLKYLATYKPGEKLDATAEDVAKATVVSFVRSNDMLFKCDLLGYPAIKALKDTKSANVLGLLETMLTGDGMGAFAAFAKSNGDVFKTLSVDEAECAGKMKVLALCALAESATAASSSGEVTYAQVAAALQCADGEVEGWIVRAIGARLIEAKMDQLRGVAVVTRVTHRVFGKEQWANLRARLDVWRENLAGAAGEVSKALDAGAEALVAH